MSRINQLARGTAYGRLFVYMYQYCLLTRVLKAEKKSTLLCVHGGRASRTRVPFESLGLTGNLD